eukprot:CAMPEP_0203985014 /NCGR_PEP_ID=MMETSP0360-20130528/5022_1 /ASSEMBLY_ACC=CAM_ASM_000342 /TAXON_ID=268821 /ORGANISM="Scrippsiella Hangoei, Strain SHTV-5" /LENGTH=72 /DNA_ID=CAMNT_0050924219 /DNA_START=62 /DNA_END=277 /DNA_ORIENTATION=+
MTVSLRICSAPSLPELIAMKQPAQYTIKTPDTRARRASGESATDSRELPPLAWSICVTSCSLSFDNRCNKSP